MPLLSWDASALAKQYAPELGDDTIEALLNFEPASDMVLTYMGYAETAAILRRKFNRGQMSQNDFDDGRQVLENDVLYSGRFILLTIQDEDVMAGVALSDKHNINSTDAAILAAYINFVRSLPAEDLPCILVAADQRLLRAALVEGLDVLNPETFAAADVASLLTRRT